MVEDSYKAVECDNCAKWQHIKCSGIKIELYNAMVSDDSEESGVRRFCKDCCGDIKSCLKEIMELKDKFVGMRKDM